VLVDTLGLGRFRPRIGFAVGFLRFLARPRPNSFERFMGQCAFDLDELRHDLNDDWPSFVAYNLAMATSGTVMQDAFSAKPASHASRPTNSTVLPCRPR
jgi:hypothetical protein